MFFFLRPKFKMSGFVVNHIPWFILFLFFPFCYIVFDDYDEITNDEFWED